MLLARTCPVCERAGDAPCAACFSRLRSLGEIDAPALVDRCFALLHYDAASRPLVTELKFANNRAAVRWLGDALAHMISEAPGMVPATTATWAPTAQRRARSRGFDQARLLARAVARPLRIPARRLLVRLDGSAQTGADRAHRLSGPEVEARVPVRGAVLLVDDVTTTGATLTACSAALRAAGAQTVVAATVAHRPWTP